MKLILKIIACLLITVILFLNSCKKEYSCENCIGKTPPLCPPHPLGAPPLSPSPFLGRYITIEKFKGFGKREGSIATTNHPSPMQEKTQQLFCPLIL